MRRHLPLASASAVVCLVLASPLLPGQAVHGQEKSSIQAQARVVNIEASQNADAGVRQILERAFHATPPTGSPMDMVMRLKAAALHAPDGIGVFFDFEGERADRDKFLGDGRLASSAARALAMKQEMAATERLVVYVHHLAN